MATTIRPARPQPVTAFKAPVNEGVKLTVVASDLAPVSASADRAVFRWLVACAVAVALAGTVGSLTRLPESNLSIADLTLISAMSWEWTHRILAGGVGFVLAVPFFVLLLRRRIRPGMRLRLMNLPLLAALQGGIGWYMVQGALPGRTDVSPYRLGAHLVIALVIFAIAVWTALELRNPSRT